MSRLLKKDVQKRSNEIKSLILSDVPFTQPLTQLYLDLSQHGKHTWLVEVYYFLSLYVEKDKQPLLYHPALLQALLALGKIEQAKPVAYYLKKQNPVHPETLKFLKALQTRQESILAPYTAVASLSKYAQPSGPKKRPLADALPARWMRTLATITPEKLAALGYFLQRKKLKRTPLPYRDFLLSHFDEMTLNYLFQHNHSVVMLAGAMLEMLLSVHFLNCLHVKQVRVGKQRKYIFNLNLSELIDLSVQKKLLPEAAIRLCRAARMQRNFIHPGKEILEHTRLSAAGAQVCFLAVLETIDALL